MKQKKIENQLRKGYLLVLLMILAIGYLTYMIYTNYEYSQSDKSAIDMDVFLEDYHKDPETAFTKNSFTDDDFVIVTDMDYKMLSSYNYELNPETTLLEVHDKYLNNDFFTYYVFESISGNELIHLFLAPLNEEILIYIIIILVALALIIAIVFLYARSTSQNIVTPIKELVAGVKKISNGKYGHHISYETNTELDSIKDHINQMSEALKKESERRETLEQERNELLMNLSHDIKTPLTNIIGYAQTLNQQELEPQIKSSVETIYKYGLLASRLTEELFDYTKINNHNNFPMENLNIVEITRVKLIEYVNELEALNISYEFDLPETSVNCHINTMMYERVLDNLIQNSIKYNHKDFSLKVALHETTDKIIIVIEDNGIGIPLKYHSTIFDPMVRVESSRNRELGGSGLGLSIAKQVMHKHNGSIRLDSEHSKGCRFIIELPKKGECIIIGVNF